MSKEQENRRKDNVEYKTARIKKHIHRDVKTLAAQSDLSVGECTEVLLQLAMNNIRIKQSVMEWKYTKKRLEDQAKTPKK